MSETIVVVGANHAGTAAVNTILTITRTSMVVFDRSSVISFLGCGMALWIGGQISGPAGCFMPRRRPLSKRALAHMETEVTAYRLCRKARHRVHKDGAAITQSYDRAYPLHGSVPICPFCAGHGAGECSS